MPAAFCVSAYMVFRYFSDFSYFRDFSYFSDFSYFRDFSYFSDFSVLRIKVSASKNLSYSSRVPW